MSNGNNNLLALCKKRMEKQRIFHPDIDIEDTGAIVAIIMYFIAKEPSICTQKLECYLILLDRICVHRKGYHLFSWQLNEKGRIRYFRDFINSIQKQKLIYLRKNSKYYFEFVEGCADSIIAQFPLILSNVISWLNNILYVCKDMNSKEMLSRIIGTREKTNQAIARNNILKAMENNLKLYQQEQSCNNQVNEPEEIKLIRKLLGL